MSELAAQFDLLWQLRDLDAAVYEAQERARRAEREFSSMQATENAARKRMDEAKRKLHELEHSERETESELKDMQKRLGALEDQANSATSDSIRKHSVEAVEKHKQHLDETENKGLALLDEIEKARSVLKTHEAAVRQAADKSAAANGALAGVQTQAEAKRAELAPQRDALSGQMTAAMLQAYESARGKYPDSPICGIKDSYCLGCSGELNMHHTTRVKARTELLRCPHCGRIHDMK
jgi:predicted  nucleic acid-binding Zn-ribbon protein